jgi:hypothetical protein
MSASASLQGHDPPTLEVCWNPPSIYHNTVAVPGGGRRSTALAHVHRRGRKGYGETAAGSGRLPPKLHSGTLYRDQRKAARCRHHQVLYRAQGGHCACCAAACVQHASRQQTFYRTHRHFKRPPTIDDGLLKRGVVQRPTLQRSFSLVRAATSIAALSHTPDLGPVTLQTFCHSPNRLAVWQPACMSAGTRHVGMTAKCSTSLPASIAAFEIQLGPMKARLRS